MQYPQSGGVVMVRHSLPHYSLAELPDVSDMPEGAASFVPELGLVTYSATGINDVASVSEPGGWSVRVPASLDDGGDLSALEDLEDFVEDQALRLGTLESERTTPRTLAISSTSVSAGSSVSFDLTWPGVAAGDVAHVSPFEAFPASLALRANCPSAGVVRVRAFNPTGGSVSTGAGDLQIAVIGRA